MKSRPRLIAANDLGLWKVMPLVRHCTLGFSSRDAVKPDNLMQKGTDRA